MSECRIAFVGKSRNGGDRYWCMEHHSPAYGKNGARLAQCLAVSKDGAWDKLSREPDSQRSPEEIMRRAYLPAAYDTTFHSEEGGGEYDRKTGPVRLEGRAVSLCWTEFTGMW